MADIKIIIPKQFEFLFKPKKVKVMYGGRVGAKSHSIARALLVMGIQRPMRIFCGREFYKSIETSVHKLLGDINDEYGLGYTVGNTVLRNKIGTEITFGGLKINIRNKKSMEKIDIAWIEEAETISQESIDVFEPTILRNDKSEIWYSLNPFSEMDAVYKTYITPYVRKVAASKSNCYTDAMHYVMKTGYEENPFLGDEMRGIIDNLRKADFKKYKHIYGGHPLADHDDVIIEAAWFDAAIDLHKKLNIKVEGLKAVGYDPSDGKSDPQGVVYRTGSVITRVSELTTELAHGVASVYHRSTAYGAETIMYDVIGVGTGVKALLEVHDPSGNVEPQAFNGAREVDNSAGLYLGDLTNKEVFRNLRAQHYSFLADRFKRSYRASQGEYIDPDTLISIDRMACKPQRMAQLKAELCSIRRTKSTSRALVQIESKQDMKSRGMDSPNLADAMMYAFAARPKKRAFESIDFASGW